MARLLSILLAILFILGVILSTSCRPVQNPEQVALVGDGGLHVLAVESFLADISQNIAGDRLQIETLMPGNLDPHTFEPTPNDLARVANSQVLIVNGAGLEEWLEKALDNAGGERLVIEASAGLESRQPDPQQNQTAGQTTQADDGDPHFWLNPTYAVRYVENIRDGLSRADPSGINIYARNADDYIAQLHELDTWIAQQVALIPAEHRKMVTNHESFGYFADRYGLQIIGTILPGVSTSASPSALQMANLVNRIKTIGAKAIFLETGSNPDLAQQIAQETSIPVITDLYTHSLSDSNGPAPTYLAMMKHNTQIIVEALK